MLLKRSAKSRSRLKLKGTTTLDLIERIKIDYYMDQIGNIIFTERYHIKRGVCCGLGCRHCPFFPKYEGGNKELSDELKTFVKTST